MSDTGQMIEYIGEAMTGHFDFGVDGGDAELAYQYEIAGHVVNNLPGMVIAPKDEVLTSVDRAAIGRAVAVMNAAEELREAESAEHPNPTEEHRIFEAQMELMNTTDAIQPADLDRLTALATGGAR